MLIPPKTYVGTLQSKLEKYSFVFQIKSYSLRNACPSTRMQFLACVSMQLTESWIIWGSRLRHAVIQLPHEALSNYLVVDHVAHSKFDASSSPFQI
jgi:hypothetical protein